MANVPIFVPTPIPTPVPVYIPAQSNSFIPQAQAAEIMRGYTVCAYPNGQSVWTSNSGWINVPVQVIEQYGTLLVPLRRVVENFGGSVYASEYYGGISLECSLDGKAAYIRFMSGGIYVNNRQVYGADCPLIVQNRAMVPVSFMAMLGIEVRRIGMFDDPGAGQQLSNSQRTFTAKAAEPANNNQDKRQRVVQEAFFALSQGRSGTSGKQIPNTSNYLGDWNYLASDFNAYNQIKTWYTVASTWNNYFNDPQGYGFSEMGGDYGNVGRGGQCRSFANLVFYRSGVFPYAFPSYDNMPAESISNLNQAQPGDLIFSLTAYHTAIVMNVERDGSNRIISINVIDSNFVSDNKNNESDREVIARHNKELSYWQDNQYMIWNIPFKN